MLLHHAPRIVTATPIGSPFLTPQSLYADFALRVDGFFPEICSSAFVAIVDYIS